MDSIPDRIIALLKRCEYDPVMPPTMLYDEGWMLRLVMDWFAAISTGHLLSVPTGCRWYSEALLPSAFLAESRGDGRAETWTHADGVIGHFEIGKGATGNLTLLENAKHFVVLEAKMFSKLRAGTKNAKYFNQAARNVACMAEALKRARRQATEFTALGFYVLAPDSQIRLGCFEQHLMKDSIREVVERRVNEFGNRNEWLSDWFLPLLERVDIKAVSWEKLIAFLEERDPEARDLQAFYERCLKFNKSPWESGHKTDQLKDSQVDAQAEPDKAVEMDSPEYKERIQRRGEAKVIITGNVINKW